VQIQKLFRTGLAAAIALSLAAPNWAHAMTVQPVIVDLQSAGQGMNQLVTVENTSGAPLPVELQVHELAVTLDGATAAEAESDDLVAFPAQAIIAPGQTQTFRLQYVGDPNLAQSKHYYVTVAQLPVASPQTSNGVQVLYNFQVLASVGPQGARPALRVTGASVERGADGQLQAVVDVANEARTYGYLARGRLRLLARDASGREVFRRTLAAGELQQSLGMGLVAAGQSRRFIAPVALPPEAATLEAHYSVEH
jgi:P pilus assembly chaperone PapD